MNKSFSILLFLLMFNLPDKSNVRFSASFLTESGVHILVNNYNISNTIKPFIVLPILNKMFEQMLAKLLGIMFNFCLGQALIAIIKYDSYQLINF